jgi:hypothetical protein
MSLPVFPHNLMRENAILFELIGQVISAGTTASGVMPLLRTDGGGIWKAKFSEVPLMTADQVMTWRAFTATCDGGAMPVIVEMCDKRYAPVPIVSGKRLTAASVPHSDDSPHSDGTPYESGIVSAVLGNGALRATEILVVTFNGSSKPRGGEHFSIDHGDPMGDRLYRIASVENTVDGPLCQIRPPLRAPVGGGTRANFDHPRCVMRLSSPDSMDLLLQQRKFGNPSAEFVEAFPPYPPGA